MCLYPDVERWCIVVVGGKEIAETAPPENDDGCSSQSRMRYGKLGVSAVMGSVIDQCWVNRLIRLICYE
jgi:hypothetical protein